MTAKEKGYILRAEPQSMMTCDSALLASRVTSLCRGHYESVSRQFVAEVNQELEMYLTMGI
jgi:hypothetical protein